MRETDSRALWSLLRGIAVASLLWHGAVQLTSTAHAQQSAGATAAANASSPKANDPPDAPQRGPSHYALDDKTKAVTIKFKTKRDASTGVVSLDKSAFDPSTKPTIKINWTDDKGPPPAAVVVTIIVTFPGIQPTPGGPFLSGQYTLAALATPATFSDTVLSVDLSTFATTLIADINATLPPQYNPVKDSAGFALIKGKLQVTQVLNSDPTPAAKPKLYSQASKVEGELTINLQEVVGELGQ